MVTVCGATLLSISDCQPFTVLLAAHHVVPVIVGVVSLVTTSSFICQSHGISGVNQSHRFRCAADITQTIVYLGGHRVFAFS
ncbi:hypothetical protein P4S68_23310 [Pseudoalteromonas sp. Hal099]